MAWDTALKGGTEDTSLGNILLELNLGKSDWGMFSHPLPSEVKHD